MKEQIFCSLLLVSAWSLQAEDGVNPPPKPWELDSESAKKYDYLGNQGAPYLETGPYLDDSQITKKIIRAIRDDHTLSRLGKKIHVSVQHGVVTLQGYVLNEDERARIETIASQNDAVTNVNNELKVKQ